MPISWDEICWTHDMTGFADCGLVISGQKDRIGDMIMMTDPDIKQDPAFEGKRAEPDGEWS